MIDWESILKSIPSSIQNQFSVFEIKKNRRMKMICQIKGFIDKDYFQDAAEKAIGRNKQ